MSKKTISIDIETSPLSIEDIEKAAAQAAANFGKPNMIFLDPTIMPHMGWEVNPEYHGLPWADTARMTKREHAFARLHMFLYKFSVLKNLSEEQHETIRNTAIKRLKRAKWARYGSSPK